MPSKRLRITDDERAKRFRELAREAETSNDPGVFDRAFAAVVKSADKTKKPNAHWSGGKLVPSFAGGVDDVVAGLGVENAERAARALRGIDGKRLSYSQPAIQ